MSTSNMVTPSVANAIINWLDETDPRMGEYQFRIDAIRDLLNGREADRPSPPAVPKWPRCKCPEPSPYGHTCPPTTEPAESEGSYADVMIERLTERTSMRNGMSPTTPPAESVEDRARNFVVAFDWNNFTKARDEDNFRMDRAGLVADLTSFAQAEIERQTPAIKLEAIRDTLRNCPDALKEFDALPNKRDAWFCLAFGVTPSLFVDYDSSDPKTERIRLFDERQTAEWMRDKHISEFIAEVEPEIRKHNNGYFVPTEAIFEAMQTVKARREGGEGK